MTTRFLLAEGVASIRRVPVASAVGTLITAIALAIVGGFLLIALSYRLELSRVSASAAVELFLSDTLSDARISEIRTEVASIAGVRRAAVRTPEEALRTFGEDLAIDTAVTGGQNPLPPTIRVDLEEREREIGRVEDLRATLLEIEGIEEAAFPSELLSTVEDRLRLFVRIAGGLALLLLLSVVGAVAVTSQLTLVTRRTMIRTMRLLGAERRWILLPFLIQGLCIGAVGGAAAAGGLMLAAESIPGADTLLNRPDVTAGLLALIGIGGLLATFGAALSGTWYLRR